MNRPYGPYSADEKDVPYYTAPNPLRREDGSFVSTAREWMTSQREKILRLLQEYEYGEILPPPDFLRTETLSLRDDALNGTARRKEIRIHCAMKDGKKFAFDALIYIPLKRTAPAPVFLGLNFNGNHSTISEPGVRRTGLKYAEIAQSSDYGNQWTRWQTPLLISRGYASATVCYHDLFPNRTDGAADSVFSLFYEERDYPNTDVRHSVIGAWAWGLSRLLDALGSDSDIDASRAAVHGHSRLGKTALWAGAIDTRFKLVISNCSGCGGGALHRRKCGENLSQHFADHVRNGVPPWFVRKLEQFIWREEELPMDQHELVQMTAPRAVCLGTSVQDLHADPKGEFESCRLASEVYHLFGSAGLPCGTFPEIDKPVSGDISFHCHSADHDQTKWDWLHYLDLADKYLK